jgi:hypothetical protein
MGAWNVGMQDNDGALDTIEIYKKRIAAAVKKKGNLKKLFEDIDSKVGADIDATAVLGVADHMLDLGVKFDKAARGYVLECIDAELKPYVLSNWKNRKGRKLALKKFRMKVMK